MVISLIYIFIMNALVEDEVFLFTTKRQNKASACMYVKLNKF